MSSLSDMEKAMEIFSTGEYTCVLCKDDTIITSTERGVKPLVGFIESCKDYTDFLAVDKIVGKSAGHLYMLMGVKCIHASVMSREAYEFLTTGGVEVTADTFTDKIINRMGNDICPMEKAVSGIEDSQLALLKIKKTIAELQKNH